MPTSPWSSLVGKLVHKQEQLRSKELELVRSMVLELVRKLEHRLARKLERNRSSS